MKTTVRILDEGLTGCLADEYQSGLSTCVKAVPTQNTFCASVRMIASLLSGAGELLGLLFFWVCIVRSPSPQGNIATGLLLIRLISIPSFDLQGSLTLLQPVPR